MGPGDLAKALSDLPLISDPNLIVGMERAEDAGVYRLNDDTALIETLDFFTPIVDDPYTFGQIAVANALSDVYAMGGRPLTAMNIVCFPVKKMDISILKDILAGGLDKMREAEVVLVGGHSVEDNELKYGLSVTGVIHPARVVLNTGARAGDRLVLTKALGTGIINTALKGGLADERAVAGAVECMSTLNRKASELMMEMDVHACTDVTGFGLLGHACEMINGSEVGMKIRASSVPLLPWTEEYARMGLIPGGTIRNRDYRLNMIEVAAEISDETLLILFDAQTSGGLLISVPEREAALLVEKMRENGIRDAAIIGEVVAGPQCKIIVE
jgi:selenide,water dikinase